MVYKSLFFCFILIFAPESLDYVDMSEKANFERTELLIGTDAMRRMNAARVILLGVGGVGSWQYYPGTKEFNMHDLNRACALF